MFKQTTIRKKIVGATKKEKKKNWKHKEGSNVMAEPGGTSQKW